MSVDHDPPAAKKPGPGGYPAPVERLVEELAKLPGIGKRSAERIAFQILKGPKAEALSLARAIEDVKKTVRHCDICFNFTEQGSCAICADPRRDAGTVLVVEQPRDLIAMEFTRMYRGVYHVLMGRLSPLDGVGPDSLTVGDLLKRVDDPARNSRGERVQEVILALNPTLEGDGTALYVAQALKDRGVAVSRLARGLPSGGQIELSTKAMLADALEGRRPMST